jgi:hypothetical protein
MFDAEFALADAANAPSADATFSRNRYHASNAVRRAAHHRARPALAEQRVFHGLVAIQLNHCTQSRL